MKQLLCTSVGRKLLVGLTGIGVSGFALMHMSGNLLLLVGPEAYNRYGHAMTSNKAFYYTAEVILLVLFGAHLALALALARDNKRARPEGNSSAGSGPKRATFASRTMALSGLVLLVFLVLHLWAFRFGTYYSVTYGGVEMRDLYRLAVEKFAQPGFVAFYVFSMVVLGLHLSHGVSSVFQSLGLASARLPALRRVAWAFAAIVAGGFISQPLYFFLMGGR